MIKTLINTLRANPKRVFLLDGSGALLTACLLSQLLTRYQQFFGMPVWVLYWLAAAAAVFAFYSFTCYFFTNGHWGSLLSFIIAANLVYCIVSLSLVVYYFKQLTWAGVTYFVLELVVILIMVAVELICLKAFNRLKS
ncbi:MAG TPA: hypothetical protein VFV31_00105 [Chitinophagaceae bacterium]|nr:hypothetical protein [Chitinophagaceae bacterium]